MTTTGKSNSYKDLTTWRDRRIYLFVISFYMIGIILYSLYFNLDTLPAISSVKTGIAALVINTMIYVTGAVVSDSQRKKVTYEEPEFLKHTKWFYRKMYLYIVTCSLMIFGFLPLYTKSQTAVAEASASYSLLALSLILGAYVFNAVWDDKIQIFDQILSKQEDKKEEG